jgi:flagellar biosynthesis protein FlhB
MVITTSLANKFFNSMIVPLAAATVIGLIISIVSIRTWYEIFKSVGISCLLIGIAYFTFPLIDASLSQIAPGEQALVAQQIISSMFESMKTSLLIIFMIGVVLTIVGYVASYFAKRRMNKSVQKKDVTQK